MEPDQAYETDDDDRVTRKRSGVINDSIEDRKLHNQSSHLTAYNPGGSAASMDADSDHVIQAAATSNRKEPSTNRRTNKKGMAATLKSRAVTKEEQEFARLREVHDA